MPSISLKSDTAYNPLDIAEHVVMDRDWVFDRPAETELLAEASGGFCNYRMWFSWQEDFGGMSFACALDSKLPKKMLPKVYPLLALVNEKLWLGHFDISSDDGAVTFRHSLLLRDGVQTSAEHLQQLLDIAMTECERFYPAFQSVIWGGKTAAEALEIALFETVAEA